MKCKTFPFSHLSTSTKEQLLLQGKSAILTLGRYHNAFMMWGLPKQLPFLSLGKEAHLYLGWDFWLWQLDTSLDSRLGCGLRTPLSASFPAGTPCFSPLSWKWQWQKVIPCSPLLQAAAPLVWTPTPLPLQRNGSKLNVPGHLPGSFLADREFPRNRQGLHAFYPRWSKSLLNTANGLGLIAELTVYGKGRRRGAEGQSCLSKALSSCLLVRTGTTACF